ncbi:MAG: hypothetical protein JWO52_311 [Gammaproteobacteria bacterium]|jgi:hypothetical protein|nr:hypothetical protein [Gammaproteobacteria bacterium]
MTDANTADRLDVGEFEIGSAAHRHELARFFLDTHIHYEPDRIQWPVLGETERTRLINLPFWQEAVNTESETSRTVTAAAQLESDAQLRKAIELQGFEESRHARLLAELTARYRIPIQAPPPSQPGSVENDFLLAGFGECFDSFFAFGLIAIAGESGYFTPGLVEIFEPVVQEEARHILFFVNWVKYRRSQLPWWERPAFRARCGWLILKQVASRVKTAKTLGGGADTSAENYADNFTLSAHKDLGSDLTLHALLGRCLAENERRMAPYDARLLRPRLVPTIARLLYRLLPASI